MTRPIQFELKNVLGSFFFQGHGIVDPLVSLMKSTNASETILSELRNPSWFPWTICIKLVDNPANFTVCGSYKVCSP